ncbi:hypothetical protein BD408DRAFT_412190 [Parasitella parasitica]|nr:hypothetical protein BD408DRAFT_412190 [Parasitella parasitica]
MHGIGVADITKLKMAGVCTVRVSNSQLPAITLSLQMIQGRPNDDQENSLENQGFIRNKGG